MQTNGIMMQANEIKLIFTIELKKRNHQKFTIRNHGINVLIFTIVYSPKGKSGFA